MPRPKKGQTVSKQTMIMHTKNPGHVCDIEWKIDNVLKFPNQTLSSKVKLGRSCRTNLNIIIKIQECENYSHVFVGYERLDEKKTTIHVIFDLQILNSEGDVYMQTKSKFSPNSAHKVIRFLKIKLADPGYFTSAAKVTEDELQDSDDDVLKKLVSIGLVVWDEESIHKVYSLPQDSINLKGTVKVFACCVPLRTMSIHQSSSVASLEIKQSELSRHLQSAFLDTLLRGDFSDISLRIKGEIVKSHKFILSARSPKFKKLLERDSEGNAENELVIDDIDKSDFLYFLRYLYTGVVGQVKWDVVQKLYEIAIQYEVNSLIELCRNLLISGLKDRRACRALLFSTKHKDEKLKKATIDYIKVIFYEFKKSSIWETFRRDYPELANEVMHFVIDDLK